MATIRTFEITGHNFELGIERENFHVEMYLQRIPGSPIDKKKFRLILIEEETGRNLFFLNGHNLEFNLSYLEKDCGGKKLEISEEGCYIPILGQRLESSQGHFETL